MEGGRWRQESRSKFDRVGNVSPPSTLAPSPNQSRSAPVMLRILALQFLFEFRIGFTPEN